MDITYTYMYIYSHGDGYESVTCILNVFEEGTSLFLGILLI